jgi:kumamolisin
VPRRGVPETPAGDEDRVPIPGSRRSPVRDSEAIGAADPAERAEVTVVVRRRPGAGAVRPRRAGPLARADFGASFGADPADLAEVEAFAREHGLDVLAVSPERRTLELSGTVAQLSDAFAVELQRYRHPDGSDFRGRTGPVTVPRRLAGIIQGVFGLDDRPQSQPHYRVLTPSGTAAHAASKTFAPAEVGRLYGFPTGVTGRGQTIAIIEFGGGYHPRELEAYFASQGITAPQVEGVSVDGGQNEPGSGADSEVLLDIEVAGCVAPGARQAVYFAPNSDRGFLDAVSTAIHDAIRAPTVVSISWGRAESSWTAQALRALNAVFEDAAALGVTICCASGDDGSTDNVGDGRAHVDFPASSPHVLACGGTTLRAASGAITTEVTWNNGPGGGSTGGGISEVFAVPAWQRDARPPPSVNPGHRAGRGVPDVAGNADPQTGYQVLVAGQPLAMGGTSAVAPLWAGLVALLNEALDRPLGYLNPVLYSRVRAAGGTRDIVAGDNGAYSAGPGWDPCTGLGSPDGAAILAALGGQESTATR